MASLLAALSTYIDEDTHCISITGSGGKTTTLIALASLYAQRGKRVLVSTTTKLELPSKRDYLCDTYFSDERIQLYKPSKGQKVFYALQGTEKALAPPLEELQALTATYDVLLLEADGAQHKPLKLHSERDPVVPNFTTTTLAVVGMSGWKHPLGQCCFGWEGDPDRIADENAYLQLLTHPQGVLKAAVGKTLVLCNQAESTTFDTMSHLSSRYDLAPLFFGSMQTDRLFYRKVV